jgi:hypothetical protein
LAEHQIVVLRVTGSSPVGYPNINMVSVVRKWFSGLVVSQKNVSSVRVRASSDTQIFSKQICVMSCKTYGLERYETWPGIKWFEPIFES